MNTGKLDTEQLKQLILKYVPKKRPEVLAGPGIGEDCAVVDFGEYECVLSTDPITAAAEKVGSLAVHISCNDVASNGVEPLGILLTVLVPPSTTEEELERMMQDAAATSEGLGVDILGGHTEITEAVNKPVIVSTAVGKARRNHHRSEGMKPGDLLLMTKSAGLEGTGILAWDRSQELQSILTAAELERAKGLLNQISVVPEGVIAGKIGVSAMHDTTEGGVLGALWEMCENSGLGAEIREQDIPVAAVTGKVCRHYGIDPLRLISSGCMLIAARPEKAEALRLQLGEAGIRAGVIGEVKTKENGRFLIGYNGIKTEILPPGADEIYRV